MTEPTKGDATIPPIPLAQLPPDPAKAAAEQARALKARMQRQRSELREAEFGADADSLIWHKQEKAFCTVPRTLGLLCTLISDLSKGADAAQVYLDLWCRQFEDGFVEIEDEEEVAASCGYPGGPRGVRYWRQAMATLVRLGFIQVKPKNTRKYGFVLLLHPQDVVARIYSNPKNGRAYWKPIFDRALMRRGARRRPIPKAG